ncbi:M15 family metallopeptidase [Streptomyces sp. NPDC048442]|uniref:M15 family metallopeptidase n=1 Tax=Streptomyces sp. NPDC048442 TaxID=3154823 RepID=UPI003428F314
MTRTPSSARTATRTLRRLLVVGLAAVAAVITAVLGAVPHHVTVFDDAIPAVANLDPDLLRALRRAATAAADDGVELYVNSGWRSPQHQRRLLHEAVSQYGSEDEAARWVAPPATSPHVSGDAADIGPAAATTWLSTHGAGYGLCQIYRNEPWHFELRTEAIGLRCPRMYADPTQDPRMRGPRREREVRTRRAPGGVGEGRVPRPAHCPAPSGIHCTAPSGMQTYPDPQTFGSTRLGAGHPSQAS